MIRLAAFLAGALAAWGVHGVNESGNPLVSLVVAFFVGESVDIVLGKIFSRLSRRPA
jgi:hypothetical protein